MVFFFKFKKRQFTCPCTFMGINLLGSSHKNLLYILLICYRCGRTVRGPTGRRWWRAACSACGVTTSGPRAPTTRPWTSGAARTSRCPSGQPAAAPPILAFWPKIQLIEIVKLETLSFFANFCHEKISYPGWLNLFSNFLNVKIWNQVLFSNFLNARK